MTRRRLSTCCSRRYRTHRSRTTCPDPPNTKRRAQVGVMGVWGGVGAAAPATAPAAGAGWEGGGCLAIGGKGVAPKGRHEREGVLLILSFFHTHDLRHLEGEMGLEK